MTTDEILNGLPKLRGLVVGDICLDRWCTYEPALADLSRETGLPRVAVVATKCSPGGGGNLANNLAAFGLARVAVLGVAGDDGHGCELARALDQSGIESSGLIRSPEVCTFTYSKLINASTQVEDLPRVDFVEAKPLPEGLGSQIAGRLLEWYSDFDVIFGADQAETQVGGVINEPVRCALAEIGRRSPQKIVWVDSRVRAEHFRNVTIKVNRAEADAACSRAFSAVDYSRLRRLVRAERLFLTDGANETRVDDRGIIFRISPRLIQNPIDVCGAGDSFSAAAACALALGASAREAAEFGHLAAGITIMKRGTGTAGRDEIREAAAAIWSRA